MVFDTIVACITGSSPAPVAAVRLSGPESWVIAGKVFPAWPERVTHGNALYGRFVHGDDGYAIGFHEGRSYSGDQTAEFFIHGSPASVRLLIERCIAYGCRMAEPGEFTLRAVQNGRIDLTQAEAVRNTVEAQTALQLKAANDLRGGALLQEISSLREALVGTLASVEASVDFSEEIGDLDVVVTSRALGDVAARLGRLLETAETGRILREGYRVAIVGPPNAGKSSLLNALLGSDRAIVTAVAGTTRDAIEEVVDFNGLKVILTDTAGLRSTEDEVERLGVERSHRAARAADKVWYVVDSTIGLTSTDCMALDAYPAPVTVVANKIDLGADSGVAVAGGPSHNSPSAHCAPRAVAWEVDGGAGPGQRKGASDHPTIGVSALTREGLAELIESTVREALSAPPNTPVILARHEPLLRPVKEAIDHCLATLAHDLPHDLLSVDLRAAISGLGQITGETASEDMIERIFHDFCIGK